MKDGRFDGLPKSANEHDPGFGLSFTFSEVATPLVKWKYPCRLIVRQETEPELLDATRSYYRK